ncbi:MAG: hypothetical protein N4A53_14145 [Pelagimonas sp.]|jgi:hypothetical protein|nr:hypothetical protein [Pelagimonas sp.]
MAEPRLWLTYRSVSRALAGLTASLAFALLFVPGVVLWLFGLDIPAEAGFLARRAAMLFLGISIIAWLGQSAPPSELRRALCTGLAVMMGALALLGLIEFLRGMAGPGILLAIAVETLFCAAYLKLR